MSMLCAVQVRGESVHVSYGVYDICKSNLVHDGSFLRFTNASCLISNSSHDILKGSGTNEEMILPKNKNKWLVARGSSNGYTTVLQ